MQQEKKKKSGAGSIFYIVLALVFVLGGEVIALFLPIIVIGVIVYFVVRAAKKKGPKAPVEKKHTQAPKITQQPRQGAPRPVPAQTTGVDYGSRHRENAKRMLEAGLITQEEYRMQIQRSNTM